MMPLPLTSNVTRPRALGYGARLGDLYLRLAPSPQNPVRIDTAPPAAQRLNTAQTPEEFVTDFGDVFARSEFTAGEGLDRAHRRNAQPSDPARYWDSRGVRVVPSEGGEQERIELIERTEQVHSLTGLPVRLAYDGTRLIAIGGGVAHVSDNPLAPSPTFSAEVASGTLTRGIASSGNGVTYVAVNGGAIRKRDDAAAGSGTWSLANDLEADGVWWVANRLIASKGNAVYEVPLGDTDEPDPITTLAAGTTVNDVADADSAILVAASDGRVYALAPGEDGTLALAASSSFPGEVPTALGKVQNLVLVGTTQGGAKRLWRCALRGDLVLDDKRLLREWRCHETLHDIVTSRDTAYLLVHEDEDGGDVFAWRFDAQFNAIHRSHRFEGDDDPHGTGLLLIGETLFAGIFDNGVYRVSDDLEEEGWLMGPFGDFYTSEPKVWASAFMERTGAGAATALFYSTDRQALQDAGHSSWTHALTLTSGRADAPLSSVEARSIAGMVRLTGGGSTTPRVQSFGFRAYPGAGEVVVTLRVNVSDRAHSRGRHGFHAPRLGEGLYQELLAQHGTSRELEVFRPEVFIRGAVQSVETPVLAMARRGSLTWVSTVTVRGRRVSGSTALVLSGMDDTRAQCPDDSPLDITGDIDIRWFGAAPTWAAGVAQSLVSKKPPGSYEFRLNSFGHPSLEARAAGGGSATVNGDAAVPAPDGADIGLRATRRASDGRVQFFASTDDGVSWQQLGSDETALVGESLATSDAPLKVGAGWTAAPMLLAPLAGTTRRVEVRDGIDGPLVASPDFTQPPWRAGDDADSDPREDEQGNPWTLHGHAVIGRGEK